MVKRIEKHPTDANGISYLRLYDRYKHWKYLVRCCLCDTEHWVARNQLLSLNYKGRCKSCSDSNRSGDKHPGWKGGRRITGTGYVQIKLQSGDFFYAMAKTHGYVYEHRLIMARNLSRCLLSWEVVHHRNGDKQDNRLENLVLYKAQVQHVPDSQMLRSVNRLDQRVVQLEAEITLLRSQLSSALEGANDRIQQD